MYSLEHFYYGQLVHHGQAIGDMRVLARSEGITDDRVAEALRYALIPPLPEAPSVSWAVIRARQAPYFIVQAQQGEHGQTTLHFIQLPGDLWRELGGNLRALLPLIKDQLPVYNQLGDTLVPIILPQYNPADSEQQVDDMLDLMTYTRNQTNTIQSLLSAIVQGIPLVVRNAPQDPATRTAFVQGLLTLLPRSTRHGVTFAMYLGAGARVAVQIRFSEDEPPRGVARYDWSTRQLNAPAQFGDTLTDDYSRYIISQLRLDTSLVVEQTESLTPVAAWRLRQGDTLAEAMAYAAHRLKIDNALRNNLPVQLEEASRILDSDPTLSAELKRIYANHLMNLSLAMNDTTPADPVAPLLKDDANFDAQVRAQLEAALNEGRTLLIFGTLARWLGRADGPHTAPWRELAHRAGLLALDHIVQAQDTEAIHDLLDDLQAADASFGLSSMVPNIINKVMRFTARDTTLADRLLILAIQYSDSNQMRQLALNDRFTDYLAPPIREALTHLTAPAGDPQTPQGLIVKAADAVDVEYRDSVLIRLTDMARQQERLDLIDAATLSELLRIARDPQHAAHRSHLVEIAAAIHGLHLATLDAPGPTHLLAIMLTCGRYDQLAQCMIVQSRDLYRGEGQVDYIRSVQLTFEGANLSVSEARHALGILAEKNIKGIPLTVAHIGALVATGWSAELEDDAQKSLNQLAQRRELLEVIHPEAVTTLIAYFAHQRDAQQIALAARLLPPVAARQPAAEGLALIRQAMRHMTWERKTKALAFEMARQYLRDAQTEASRVALRALSKDMGQRASRRLDVAHRFSPIMHHLKLLDYSALLSLSLNLLGELHQRLSDKNRRPSSAEIIEATDKLYTGLPETERHQLAANWLNLGQTIVLLGKHLHSVNAHPTKYVENLLAEREEPRTALDVFRAAGGALTQGIYHPLALPTPSEGPLFAGRFATDIASEIDIALGLLRDLLNAFPPGKALGLTTRDIIEDVESMRAFLLPHERDEIDAQMGRHWQHLADLVYEIYRNGDPRILDEDHNPGKKMEQGRAPVKSLLDYCRYAYGRLSE